MPRLQVFDDPFAPVIEEVDTGIPAGNVTITGNLAVNGNTTLGDVAAAALTTTGNITGSNITGNQLNSQTAINAVGNIVSSTGVVQGQGVAAIAGLSGATLAISGNSTLGDAIGDTCTVSGPLNVGGNADIAGNLEVDNDVLIDGELNAAGLCGLGDLVVQRFAVVAGTLSGTFPAIADPTDPASTQAALITLLGYLRTRGDIAP